MMRVFARGLGQRVWFIYTQSCCGSNPGFHSNVSLLPGHGSPLLKSLEQKSIKTVRC